MKKIVDQYRKGNEDVRRAIRDMHEDDEDIIGALDDVDESEDGDSGDAAARKILKSVTFDKGAIQDLVEEIASVGDGYGYDNASDELDNLLADLNKGVVDPGDGDGSGVLVDAAPVIASMASALERVQARQAGLEKAIGALGNLSGRIATGLEALSRFAAGHVVREDQLDAHIEAALAKSMDALRADLRLPRAPRGSEMPHSVQITPAPEDRTAGAGGAPADAQQRLGLAKSVAFQAGEQDLVKALNLGEQQAAYGRLDRARFDALIQQANVRLGRTF